MKDNVIIAEFMGRPYEQEFLEKGVGGICEEISLYEDLRYHTSWDWLMPVISKCLEIGSNMSVERIYHSLHTQDLSFAYKEVVEFIKEHNSKDFDWCNDSGFSDVFDNNLCECTAPQIDEDVCICGRPISNSEDRG